MEALFERILKPIVKGNGEQATGNSVGERRGFDPDPNNPLKEVGASDPMQAVGGKGNSSRKYLRSHFPVPCCLFW
jgi:hypothetical protein